MDVAEGQARLDHPVGARGDAHVERSGVKGAQIKATLQEMRGLHPERAAGEPRVLVEPGGDPVAGHDAGGDVLPGGHACVFSIFC